MSRLSASKEDTAKRITVVHILVAVPVTSHRCIFRPSFVYNLQCSMEKVNFEHHLARHQPSVRLLPFRTAINPLNPELNPICYLLALLAHHFLHVSRIRVKSLTIRLLMSHIYIYIYGAPILYVSRSHTTTQHSR